MSTVGIFLEQGQGSTDRRRGQGRAGYWAERVADRVLYPDGRASVRWQGLPSITRHNLLAPLSPMSRRRFGLHEEIQRLRQMGRSGHQAPESKASALFNTHPEIEDAVRRRMPL